MVAFFFINLPVVKVLKTGTLPKLQVRERAQLVTQASFLRKTLHLIPELPRSPNRRIGG